MPGQRLTREQATRLCGVDDVRCREALERLVDTRFLCIKPDGTYARAFDGADTTRRNPAKANLRSGKSSAKISA
jgi:DNA-binding GntR family transcriptional regulator